MSWNDSDIELDFTLHSLEQILAEGAKGSMALYSHYRIVRWLGAFADQDFYADERLRKLRNLADDATVQWELYVSSHYSLEQLQKFSLDDVVLPKQHFENWLIQYQGICNEN